MGSSTKIPCLERHPLVDAGLHFACSPSAVRLSPSPPPSAILTVRLKTSANYLLQAEIKSTSSCRDPLSNEQPSEPPSATISWCERPSSAATRPNASKKPLLFLGSVVSFASAISACCATSRRTSGQPALPQCPIQDSRSPPTLEVAQREICDLPLVLLVLPIIDKGSAQAAR